MRESCARLASVLQEFAEGEVAPVAVLRLSTHLDDCETCRRRVEAHRRVIHALQRIPRVVPSADFRSSVMARVREAPLSPTPRPERFHLRLVQCLFWLVAVAGSLSTGAGAYLVIQGAPAGWSPFDPGVYFGWVGGLARVATSLLIELVSQFQVPGALPSLHHPLGWSLLASTLMLLGLAAGVLGLGLAATAKALLNHSRR